MNALFAAVLALMTFVACTNESDTPSRSTARDGPSRPPTNASSSDHDGVALGEGARSGDGALGAFAIWPHDTLKQARRSCKRSSNPWQKDTLATVRHFARDVLRWPAAEVEFYASGGVYAAVHRDAATPKGVRGNVYLRLVDIRTYDPAPRPCWLVTSVGRPPDMNVTGVGVSVRGRKVSVGCLSFGASSAEITVGYGGRRVERTARWARATVRLPFEPATSGHFLILLRDAEDRVFSACGVALPSGDFAAG